MQAVTLVAVTAVWFPHLVMRPGAQGETAAQEWRQWGGPHRNFISEATGLADRWPPEGPPVIWSRPLGSGHSAILVAADRLFTMYRVGHGPLGTGPWDPEETVIAPWKISSRLRPALQHTRAALPAAALARQEGGRDGQPHRHLRTPGP